MTTSIAYGTNANEYRITPREDQEVDQILAHFQGGYMSNYYVVKIERIYNKQLEGIYEATRENFGVKGRGVVEKLMYHGTQKKNVYTYSSIDESRLTKVSWKKVSKLVV
jgi:hypothetical protein